MTQAHTTSAVSEYPAHANADPMAEEAGVRPTAGEDCPPASPAVTFLELPNPPSVNAMFRNLKGRGRVATDVYVDWKGHAGWRLREQRPEAIHGPVLIVFNIERTNNQADVDNRVKATLDLLVAHKVIDDDKHVSGFAVAWSPKRNALMRIAIMPAADLHLEFHLAPDGRTGGWFISAPQSEEEPS